MKLVKVILFVPLVLIGILGIVVWFIQESFLIGYTHFKYKVMK